MEEGFDRSGGMIDEMMFFFFLNLFFQGICLAHVLPLVWES